MKFEIGFSPCPNDTFIFDALVNKKIDTGGIDFLPVLEDVQTLNEWALQNKLPITKLSYGVMPRVLGHYKIMNSGSALGRGVGPLLISKDSGEIQVENHHVAIPGENTTAHLLFSLAFPKAKQKIFLRYDEVEDFVLAGKGLGVIIHENRFTYQSKGLHKLVDLGDHWETKTGNPIPLGGIVIRKNIDDHISQEIDRLIRKSIEYAYSQYPQLNEFIRSNAQEMEEDNMRNHIDLYVNDFSLSLGEEGRQAVLKLMEVYNTINPAMPVTEEIFLTAS